MLASLFVHHYSLDWNIGWIAMIFFWLFFRFCHNGAQRTILNDLSDPLIFPLPDHHEVDISGFKRVPHWFIIALLQYNMMDFKNLNQCSKTRDIILFHSSSLSKPCDYPLYYLAPSISARFGVSWCHLRQCIRLFTTPFEATKGLIQICMCTPQDLETDWWIKSMGLKYLNNLWMDYHKSWCRHSDPLMKFNNFGEPLT